MFFFRFLATVVRPRPTVPSHRVDFLTRDLSTVISDNSSSRMPTNTLMALTRRKAQYYNINPNNCHNHNINSSSIILSIHVRRRLIQLRHVCIGRRRDAALRVTATSHSLTPRTPRRTQITPRTRRPFLDHPRRSRRITFTRTMAFPCNSYSSSNTSKTIRSSNNYNNFRSLPTTPLRSETASLTANNIHPLRFHNHSSSSSYNISNNINQNNINSNHYIRRCVLRTRRLPTSPTNHEAASVIAVLRQTNQRCCRRLSIELNTCLSPHHYPLKPTSHSLYLKVPSDIFTNCPQQKRYAFFVVRVRVVYCISHHSFMLLLMCVKPVKVVTMCDC